MSQEVPSEEIDFNNEPFDPVIRMELEERVSGDNPECTSPLITHMARKQAMGQGWIHPGRPILPKNYQIYHPISRGYGRTEQADQT